MNRTGFFIFCLLVFEFLPVGDSIACALPEDTSYRKAPRALLEIWLRFHEVGLCQGVDAAFEFNERGMKVRSLVENEKSFQKFQEMLELLQNSFLIELETSRPSVEKEKKQEEEEDKEEKLHDDRDPPTSLWENYELRYNLGDTLAAQQRDHVVFEDGISDWVLKQRLYLYAVQTLDWNKKMERYASDILVLVRFAGDPAVAPDLQSRANAVCLAHAMELGKVISKLNASLSQAIPKSKKNGRASSHTISASKSLVHSANQIADAAHATAQQIFRFLHPEQFTVRLNDLRDPGLLDSLTKLAKMNSDFQKEIGKSVKRGE
jgi:hypothetical protein